MRTLRFEIPQAPASRQSSARKRAAIKAAIRKNIAGAGFFLTGEVRLSVEWLINEKIRYETDTAPDLDNILKPTIDSLTGPNGILFDDCQIQRVECAWIDRECENQAFILEIAYVEDMLMRSRKVVFVQFRNGLCFPFDARSPADINLKLADHLDLTIDAQRKLEEIPDDYHAATNIMPIQRFFHRTRIKGFEVVRFEDLSV